MTRWLIALCVAALGAALIVPDADAARLGSKRSSGAQRNMTDAPKAPAQQQAGQQQQHAGQQQAAPTAGGQPAAAQSGLSRWAPMLGGLALGGLLGWMLGGSGLGALVAILLVAGLVFLAVLAFRALSRRGAEQRPMQLAGLGGETASAPPPSQASGLDSRVSAMAATAANVPAGFDVGGFLRGAKMNFVRLQVANDAGNLDEIREFTTPELFETLQADVRERNGATQQTDVLSLNADLLEVATEGDTHWASVRFSGTIREAAGTPPVEFQEVWNLSKPANGSSGWLLAGIQQLQ
jgi:predicted lipid-binding transport protein (Tim44 family)